MKKRVTRRPRQPIRWMAPAKSKGGSKKSKKPSTPFANQVIPMPTDQNTQSSKRDADGFCILKRKVGGGNGR